MAATSSCIRSNSAFASSSFRASKSHGTSIVSTLSVERPVFTSASCSIVRVSSPAPVSRMTDTAICATTRPRCRRCRRTPPLIRLTPAATHAASEPSFASLGANDRMTATTTDRSSVKASTIPSSRTSFARGEYRSASDTSNRTPPMAMISPNAAPVSASTRFSTSSSRRSRAAPAPSAARTTSSCSRRTDRMSVRFATFAAEMIMTKAAAPMSSHSVSFAFSPSTSWKGSTVILYSEPGS